MSDLGASTWSEIDASNTTAVPNGWPEGMMPAGVNNSARAEMGGMKRFWNRINAVKTTGGTSSAYTLTYDQAASQYYDGEIFTFIANATNAAAATLNINTLGARQITLFGANLLAGAIISGQAVTVRYKLSDTTFEIIPQNGMVRLGSQSPSATTTIDFTGIGANVNHLQAIIELKPATNNLSILMQTYGADGVLDTGGSDYGYLFTDIGSDLSTDVLAGSAASMPIGSSVHNGNAGFQAILKASNIQAETYTKFNLEATYFDQGGVIAVSRVGSVLRFEADRITGFRISSASNLTGKITTLASA